MIQINHSFVVALYYHQNDTNSILFVENLISLKDKIVRRRKTFEKKKRLNRSLSRFKRLGKKDK